MNIEPGTVNGINIYPFRSTGDLMEFAFDRKGILVAVNAEKILHATDETRGIINRNTGYCDGWGAVAAMKKKGFKHARKIAGCELWLEIIKKYHRQKTYYLVGGRPEIIAETVRRLQNDYPGISILNYRDGYLRDAAAEQRLIDDIASKAPDIVFVAMGSPRQELLMERMMQRHPAVYQGLGGSFDVYTGKVKRAPRWWVDHHLEWAYRLLRQPSRIVRQTQLVKFLLRLTLNKW